MIKIFGIRKNDFPLFIGIKKKLRKYILVDQLDHGNKVKKQQPRTPKGSE